MTPSLEDSINNAIEGVEECLEGFNKKECELILFMAKNRHLENAEDLDTKSKVKTLLECIESQGMEVTEIKECLQEIV